MLLYVYPMVDQPLIIEYMFFGFMTTFDSSVFVFNV